ncbi:MAG: MATE family efflux transporter [Lachnospiraceae bacterium]|nr:MATE family efflux transporter [Lachnospiraceae bacterium]
MNKTTTRDMTTGNIAWLLIQFSIPLIIGNLFQIMYNTVDLLVVGNFVGKEALAAVGSTTMIVNIVVFFFNGVSTGATVVISRFFGAGDREGLHRAIETTMLVTLIIGALATIGGVAMVRPMLAFQSTPADVVPPAAVYLRIYFGGISGLLIYNMGSGILRAVGDTKRPLYFLAFTSVMNVLLDLLFTVVFKMGIAGVGYATILAQFISAAMVLLLLTRTRDIYRLTWNDLRCDRAILGNIFRIGLPAGIQSILTAFSNVFVQSYINSFGSACMAGWSCYNKMDSLIFLPMNSMSQAATTFVGQNMGAGKEERVNKGTFQSILLILAFSLVACTMLFVLAIPATGLFTKEPEVLEYGAMFIHLNVFFILFNCVNHTLAGGLRGRGDSTGPMVIMLLSFVAIRQLYLFVMTRYISNTPAMVGLSYPVGWTACCIIEVAYFYLRWVKPAKR